MKRRSFLKLTGGVCTSAFLGSNILIAGQPSAGTKDGDILVNRSLLQSRNQNRSTVVFQNGIVCSSQPLASMAGVDILKAGGNAVDAAVCASAMLSLVEPMMCGPGGDLFAIVWNAKEQRLLGLNASGRSPYDWSLSKALALGLKEIPLYSPLSWSVPGCVSGWAALQKRLGRFDLAKLLEAPISYARKGFPVSPVIARSWPFGSIKNTTLARTFMPDGKPLRFGDIFRNMGLARFFEIIARDGAEAFYRGQIAERIVKFSQANGGRLSIRDFRDHIANWVEPVSTKYRGYDVWELPPNGQGIAALQMLNLLEHFDIASMKPNSAEHLHLFIEAKKLTFEDRAVYYADMDFAEVPLKELISKEYAKERVKLIDPQRAAQKVEPGRLKGSSDTVYLTTADKDGNMVSLIQSIYYPWGSGFVPDDMGFCLQNRGQLFSLNPNHLNKLEPHKRPFHTIIPAFMTRDGGTPPCGNPGIPPCGNPKPVFSFGVMGGSFQPQGHLQILMNIIDFGYSPQQAGEQPRVRHFESSTPTGQKMAGGGSVGFERHIPEDVKLKLANMGHKLRPEVGTFGGYQGIWRKSNPRRYFGASDPRKDGCAIGY